MFHFSRSVPPGLFVAGAGTKARKAKGPAFSAGPFLQRFKKKDALSR